MFHILGIYGSTLQKKNMVAYEVRIANKIIRNYDIKYMIKQVFLFLKK